eukprot:1651227-Prymnesium_polylepis.1
MAAVQLSAPPYTQAIDDRPASGPPPSRRLALQQKAGFLLLGALLAAAVSSIVFVATRDGGARTEPT